MLIRSQNESSLLYFEQIGGICIDKNTGEIVAAMSDGTTEVFIGNYETEEKARKVLDMIQDWYRYNRGVAVKRGLIPDPVFQMPQDEEVEE